MPTNLAIDDELIEEARTIVKHKTKKAVVTEALKEYIEKRKQMENFDVFGTVVYESDHDYHVHRNVK